MPKKLKFNPEITRVKLNPEQAVLQCACYDGVSGAVYTLGDSQKGTALSGCQLSAKGTPMDKADCTARATGAHCRANQVDSQS